MRKGKCDYKALEKLRDNIQDFADNRSQEFAESVAKELAARLLAKVIKATPVKDGDLRRGWTAGKSSNAKAYVDTLTVHHFDGSYVIEIVNPMEYASYVEFGHRTANHKGWVRGAFALTISEKEMESLAPKIIEKKMLAELGALFK